ncbi:SbcC/MukB-like Walker B domain-containing protein [uncultured Tolumonas sp.]|uniref:ATP-binding protein n=1 Tax=uncultured Tolumonas sp. TaxID=263765 RepID=UPI002A0A9C46|nr:SbcC/MukB-like Walker B domain-containing protein [uncultured Tolumonas sp.]
MISEPQTASLFAREQFRMTHLQVYNWGTFSGLHDVPISERGFLFVGRSGAGKSTLLDAFSALLTPPRWIDFNAAAREADRSGRDRNLVTYIRGAWAEQKDGESGEIATRYLRAGTTWSALALTYQNALGQYVVLAQVFWLRGNANGSTDVKRLYLVMERAFDLRELEDFGQSNFDIRKLKQSFPDAFARDEFRPYCERFCRLLGIENEMALRLLHKTQSAKNLGDLNTFLRDFMLDKPETFEVADRLVSEFGELSAAHQAVVTAREQVQTLVPAREQHQRRDSLMLQHNGLDELRLGVDSYQEIRRIELLKEHVAALEVQANGSEGEVGRRQSTLDNHTAILRDLERQHREAGGDQIEQWEADKSALEGQRTDRLRKRGQAEDACKKLGWSLSDSPQAFAELLGDARQEVENWEQRSNANREEQFRLAGEKRDAEAAFSQAVKEVQALQRQPSNIPADMLEMRRDIAAAIGISESALPFVGELVEVKPDEAEWQGAIERVLHGFALSLLVDERQYSALANHINNTHLGQRLVYYRTGRPETWQAKPINVNSLVLKLNVKEGIYADWLQTELRQRFDYACVDSIQSFRNADRAITREGQVKHSKTRHEKDDRRSVGDRRNWVLGFDNREKLGVFQAQAQEQAEAIAHLGGEIEKLSDQDKNRAARAMQCQTLVNLQWQEIDLLPLLERISTLERQIREAREGNTTLLQISEQIGEQKKLLEDADKELRQATRTHDSIIDQIKTSMQKLESLLQDASIAPLTPHQVSGLDERFAKQSDSVRLDNLDKVTTSVERALNAEIEEVNRGIGDCEKEIEARFADFKRQWPMDAGDMDTSLASAPDFFAKLVRLETDGLPAHEQRFFELLQNQSHQNLAALSTYLNDARKAILERMDLVNDSLSEVPFNQSTNQRTYLHIDASDRQLVDVKEFKQEIQQTLSYAWTENREFAEVRFLTLRRLVDRLASQDPEQKRWRETVLDVRQHVEFIGREIDESGIEVEIYRSGAGKSGGQRQKLATTCLAAALRYQLGGNDHGVPMYAPVILDEAFDKADNEFTALAMNIFTNFGFQMVVATPLKSVMTLEPFIGGACFVDINDRRVSGVLLIEYDNERQRLKLPDNTQEETSIEAS